MAFLDFTKDQLQDVDFSLQKEILQANTSGAYCSSTLLNCNTRKYHGLLIVHQPQLDGNRYVLLSSLDETIVCKENAYQLGMHRYPGTYHPHGYQYIESFSSERIPMWTIRTPDASITKEILLSQSEERTFIRYTIENASDECFIRFQPFLAFRNIHALSKANFNPSRKNKNIANGVAVRMYDGFSELCLQCSKDAAFIPAPDWYYNFEYPRERERGYDFNEDLYAPGYFELPVKKGDRIIFSAGILEAAPKTLAATFARELKKISPQESLSDCLEHSARQFIVERAKKTTVIAGFHWFGSWGRDTFIALPGLTIATGEPATCKAALVTAMNNLRDGLLPNTGEGSMAAYNSADAALWFIWALQQYATATRTTGKIWGEFGHAMRTIVTHYRNGTHLGIRMEESGLLYAGEQGTAVTWMDAVVDGKPVTPRIGNAVELNALWYNAVRFALESARTFKSKRRAAKNNGMPENNTNDADTTKAWITEWEAIPQKIEQSFTETFWDAEKGYLADCMHDGVRDWSLRPNQILAISLPYSPITNREKALSILSVVEKNLLTPRGLRTLAPDDPHYIETYIGNQRERDRAYHQGTVWTWLFGPFAEAYLKIHGDTGRQFIQTLYDGYSSALREYGVGAIAEIYNGNAPHGACGAISQAWSVSELLRVRERLAAMPESKTLNTQTAHSRAINPANG